MDLTALFPLRYEHRDLVRATSGMGRFGALSSLVLPGLGSITGKGALAKALSKLSVSAAEAVKACGVAACLVEQGLSQGIASETAEALRTGSAVVALECPTEKLGEFEVMEILNKYQAQTFGRTGTARKAIYAI